MNGPNSRRIKKEICDRFYLWAKQVSVSRGRGTASGWVKVRVNADRQVVLEVEEFLIQNADTFGFYTWTNDYGEDRLELSVSDWDGRQFVKCESNCDNEAANPVCSANVAENADELLAPFQSQIELSIAKAFERRTETFEEAKRRLDSLLGIESTFDGKRFLIYRSPTGFPLAIAHFEQFSDGRYRPYFGQPNGLQSDWFKINSDRHNFE